MPRNSPLASPSATRDVLRASGLDTKKALGQHFLVNDNIVGRICDLAQISPDDAVIEVGPGIGTLTLALLARGASVVAVERDVDLPPVLAGTCAGFEERLTVLCMDALKLDDSALSAASSMLPAKFVANLPYAVAATLVLDFFERFPCLESATVMVQREVAERIIAEPGSKDYGAYTVKLRLYAKPAGSFSVAPGNFYPPPRVESTVVRLDRSPAVRKGAALSAVEVAAACVMADAAFASRRKTLANSCKTYFSAFGETGSSIMPALPALFDEVGIDAGRRGETLTTNEFAELGRALLSIDPDAGRRFRR